MRHVPVTIDRVTMEAAADMIVHPAGRHFAQRPQSHFERVLAGGRGIGILPMFFRHWLEAKATFYSRIKSGEEIERRRPREYPGHAKTAFARLGAAIEL